MSALQSMMPPVQYADVNGLRMAYYEAGPRNGVPIILCHGFPETAFSWRHQLKALSEAGRWVIAPDQRGYGLTGGPEAVEAYDIAHLTDDLAALLDHLGADKGVFCGHDWGGAVVWQMALRHPDRVAGVIGVNTPFTPRAPADPIEIMRSRLGEEMYIVHLQKPEEADAILGADVRKTLNFFFKKPPAGERPSRGMATERKADDPSVFPLVRIVEGYDPAADRREAFLSDEEFDAYVQLFERSGFTGGINWYRNISRNWRLSEGMEDKITAPALMIMAQKDAVLPPSAADGMERYIPDLEKVLVEDSGHWTQQEQPEAVGAILLDWLARRFPL
jgi:pimeloyl-ACP methyl ester carboxylesterase